MYLKDEASVTAILDGMKPLNLTDEMGSSDDISAQVVKSQGDARKLFDAKALELSDKEKISSLDAAEMIKKKEPELYKMAYPGAVK